MAKQKIKTIRIYKDPKMFYSEWAIFLIGFFMVWVYVSSMVDIINSIKNESTMLAFSIIFILGLMRLMSWISLPISYATQELIEDMKIK